MVRWHKSNRDYVFNGRFGALIPAPEAPAHDFFLSTDFILITDKRPEADKPEDTNIAEPVSDWKFLGKAPTVQQFLEGIGETVSDDPEKPQEVPLDARSFLARPDYQMAAGGRTRVPRGAFATAFVDDSDHDEEENQIRDQATVNATFSKLMNKNKINDEKDRSDSSSQAENDADVDEKNIVFQNLFSNKAKPLTSPQRTPPLSAAVTKTENRSPAAATSSHGRVRSTLTLPPRSKVDGSLPEQDDSFPNYNNRYARVDRVGLTSNASHQAQWLLENPRPSKPKSSRRGIARRQNSEQGQSLSPRLTSGSSAAMSLSTGPELQDNQQSSTAPTITSNQIGPSTGRNCADTQFNSESWANNVLKKKAPSGRLVDDSAPPSPAKVKLPPGLGPPQTYQAKTQPFAQIAPQTVSSPLLNSIGVCDKSQTLIDLDDSEGPTQKPKVRLPSRAFTNPLQPSRRIATVSTRPNNDYADDDQVIERLQTTELDAILKRNTMRQGAGKKTKKKKKATQTSTSGKNHAALQKPDPVPLTKKASLPKQGEAVTTVNVHSVRPIAMKTATLNTGSTQVVEDVKKIAQDKPATGISGKPNSTKHNALDEPDSNIGKLLLQVTSTADVEDAELEVRFGLLLVSHPTDKDFFKGIFDSQALQSKLQNSALALHTNFFPRMTTSESDARSLLSLVDGDEVRGRVEYEIHIKNPEGGLRIVRFEQSDRRSVQVLVPDTSLGAIYMHYPVRVWDAHAVINERYVDTDMEGAVGTFLSTMQTIDNAPSFQAMISFDSMSIETVYVKRIFSKTNAEGIELEITEVQDLERHSLKSVRYNFKAVTYPRETMIQQQRLWWECRIRVQPPDSLPADEIQSLVDDMMSKTDGVGFENMGPWVKNKEKKLNEASEMPETPFW